MNTRAVVPAAPAGLQQRCAALLLVAPCVLAPGAGALAASAQLSAPAPAQQAAQEPPAAGAALPVALRDMDMAQWIERLHSAPCNRPYSGVFVVLPGAGAALQSARIWHACSAGQRLERVQPLTGTPRTIFRRNDELRTFFPQERIVRTDRRDAAALFSRPPPVSARAVAQFYAPTLLGQEPVAGLASDVVWFRPLDRLRYGYRLWSERDTGLVLKLQTLAHDGRVLEQAAFSELEIDAPVCADQLARLMDATRGYTLVPAQLLPTSARAEGWGLRAPVAGFVPVSCHKRPGTGVLQCLYSDGLASVSLFLEPFDAQRHPQQTRTASMGATQLLAQRLLPDVWLTAVGEVPLPTLELFAAQLERLR